MVRFLFGFPFALTFLAVLLAWSVAHCRRSTLLSGWISVGALTQIAAQPSCC